MSVSASEDDIGDVADEFMPPCQRVHATAVTVYMAAGDRTWVAGSQANRLDHSATAHRHRIVCASYRCALYRYVLLLGIRYY